MLNKISLNRQTSIVTMFTLLALLLSITYRAAMSLNSHSGYQVGPKYGDFEAQRHWLEITHHLPIGQWYFNSTENNLEYWGLDYPPLTAYHSWLTSQFAPKSVIALMESRGSETLTTRLFMRMTVLIWDLFMFIAPIIVMFRLLLSIQTVDAVAAKVGDDERERTKSISVKPFLWSLLYVLMQPSIVLIDHGHFQYNSVSIGLTLWAIVCFLKAEIQEAKQNESQPMRKRLYLIGSALFCCSLNFKQMALYYSLPVFFYLTGKCIWRSRKVHWMSGIYMFMCIGVTVICSFAIIWLPFLTSREQFNQVVHRIFPLHRGLFEDKVANIWCSLSLVYKVHLKFDTNTVLKLSALLTLLTSLPSCIHVMLKPTIQNFLFCLVNVSTAFFLWSYHVHEKTILFVTVPASILLMMLRANQAGTNLDEEYSLVYHWFIIVATFSMYPLLHRDGLAIAYVASILQYFVLTLNNPFDVRNMFFNTTRTKYSWKLKALSTLITVSLIGCFVIHAITIALPAPKRYPDLYTFMCTVYSCAHFVLFLLYSNFRQMFVTK